MREDAGGANDPRIVHVITGLGSGGAERMLTRVVTASRARGSNQTVISLIDEGRYGQDLRDSGATLFCLGMQAGRPDPRKILELATLLRRSRPSVIMTWMYHADLAGLLAALFAGVHPRRVVWNIRCSDLDQALIPRSTSRVIRMLAWLSRLPDAVAVNSEAGRAHHVRLGYRPRRWIDLPNGVDLKVWRPDAGDRARVRGQLDIDETAPLIGMVARVHAQKDHTTFLSAAEQVATARPEARFLLIGKGTPELQISDILRSRLIALDDRSDVPELMRALDLHVLSSAFGEGFPNVIIEAMASGVPCVSTDVGDAARIVGGTGGIAPPRDPAALAEQVLRVLSEQEPDPGQLAQRVRARVAAHYALDHSVALYEDCWQSVWREAGRAGAPSSAPTTNADQDAARRPDR